jgi:uncharacterized protein (DUF58 family)
MVRQFAGAATSEVHLDFDVLPGLDTERRLEHLAWEVDTTERDGRRYELTLGARSLPLDGGPEHRRRCLEALALYGRGETR